MHKSKTIFNEKSIAYCPRCQMPFSRQQGSGDYVHNCNSGNAVLDNESILVIGNWTDYTGSDLNTQQNRLQTQGMINTLQGQRAGIEGAKFEPVNNQGFPTNRYRQRAHQEWIDKKDLKINQETDESEIEEFDGSN